METINYQGQQIEAEVVNAMGGELRAAHLPNDFQVTHQGDERLLRDHERRYYLERKLQIWDLNGSGQRHTSGRVQLHRLSLKAAVLWATMRFGSETADLRRDARAVLAGPAMINPTRRFADGSMLVSLHLKPGVASLVRAAAELDEETPLGFVYTSVFENVVGALTTGAREREKEIGAVFDEHEPAEYEAAKPAMLRLLNSAGAIHAEAEIGRDLLGKLKGQVEHNKDDWQFTLTSLLEGGLRMEGEWVKVVELDDLAETLLWRYHRQEYGEARYEKVMPGDVVNGVLVNWLEAMLKIDEGRTDRDAIEQAHSRRRGGLSDADDKVIQQVEAMDECDITLRMLNADGTIWDEADLEPDLSVALRDKAKERGLSLEQLVPTLLREFFARHSKEGVEAKSKVALSMVDGDFHLEPKAEKLLTRYCKKAPDLDSRDVVNAALINWLEAGIEGLENSPEGRDVEVAAARRRRMRRGEQPPQLARVTSSSQEDTDGSMAVLVRFKPEPARLLRAACLKNDCSAESYLYHAASTHVVSDLSTTPENEREIEHIFEENAPDEGESVSLPVLDLPMLSDAEYIALVDSSNQAADLLRKGRQEDALQALVKGGWRDTVAEMQKLVKRIGVAFHGLNAAAPETISEEEVAAARRGDAVPIRDVLLDMVADWRIKAAEARATGQDAKPYPASHKLHGQADLLEACADQIEAIATGKEDR